MNTTSVSDTITCSPLNPVWSAQALIDTNYPENLYAIPEDSLLTGCTGQVSARYFALQFPNTFSALSSAVLNGGSQLVNGYLNLHVTPNCIVSSRDPAALIRDTLAADNLAGEFIGMMTAASMRSLRIASVDIDNRQLIACVTAGLNNARRAGDSAEHQFLGSRPENQGTINVLLACSMPLSGAAQVEAMMVATEAKAAVMQAFGIVSPVSGAVATGTGTDAVAIVCPPAVQSANGRDDPIQYAGKHTLLGELIARLVMAALSDSIGGNEASRQDCQLAEGAQR